MPRTTRSLSTPITLTSVAVALSLALLVGWTLLIIDTLSSGTTWLLILGGVSIAFITTVLLMSGISLAREIVEGRHQRNFVDSVTHELKSPLASLGLCLETLTRPDLSTAQRDELHEMMRHDVVRLSAFIDGVLEASRVAHKKREERALEPVVLFDLIESALDKVLRRYPGVARAAVTLDVPAITLTTDELALRTILENLLDNALKYSPAPATDGGVAGAPVSAGASSASGPLPTVRISARADREGQLPREIVRIAVADHGIGIAARDLERVFRRFHRGDSPEVRERSGTGLGLHVAAELARGLGGRIEASSPGVGHGATFVLTLPGGAP